MDPGLDIFDQVGARSWANRVRTEMRAAGVALKPRHTRAVDGLTPEQSQIVQFAATGLSNPEIADKLF